LVTTEQNHKLYLKLLHRFAENHQQFTAQFAEALHSDDPQAASRCAHSFKCLKQSCLF
jgi:two-component system, sensor histidine kinase and response regulator